MKHYHDFWEVNRPTTHMRKLCESLGSQYRIRVIDLEQVIYRDFGNGYDVEISGMNTRSLRKTANIYVWKDGREIVERISNVPQEDIVRVVDGFYERYGRAAE